MAAVFAEFDFLAVGFFLRTFFFLVAVAVAVFASLGLTAFAIGSIMVEWWSREYTRLVQI